MSAHSFFPDAIGVPTIEFTFVEIEFELDNTTELDAWLKKTIEREECRLHSLNFILCSDEYLHRINVEYLNHDTLTDVITFPYEQPPIVHGDIFISLDRVRENAKKYDVHLNTELHRVMVHGVFHLCGYGDKTESEAKAMRAKENEALGFLNKK